MPIRAFIFVQEKQNKNRWLFCKDPQRPGGRGGSPPYFIMTRQIGMLSVRFPDGQFGSELINGPEIEPQTLLTGILQPQCVSREVYFSKFALFDKRQGGSLNLK